MMSFSSGRALPVSPDMAQTVPATALPALSRPVTLGHNARAVTLVCKHL